MFLNSNLEIYYFVSDKSIISLTYVAAKICDIIQDHISVHNIRLRRSNTDRNSMTHAGGPHWPEHDALTGIASIVVED